MERKSVSLLDFDVKFANESGKFSGYASVWGGVDSYGDTILKGAYKETLVKHGMPKMFIMHKSYELPIGKWLSAKEDDKGLFVEVETEKANNNLRYNIGFKNEEEIAKIEAEAIKFFNEATK